jgi:hypothetical protein
MLTDIVIGALCRTQTLILNEGIGPGVRSVPEGLLMVAWHEVPGKVRITIPSRRERCDLRLYRQPYLAGTALAICEPGPTHQTVPYGTGSLSDVFQALRARPPSCSPSGTKNYP